MIFVSSKALRRVSVCVSLYAFSRETSQITSCLWICGPWGCLRRRGAAAAGSPGAPAFADVLLRSLHGAMECRVRLGKTPWHSPQRARRRAAESLSRSLHRWSHARGGSFSPRDRQVPKTWYVATPRTKGYQECAKQELCQIRLPEWLPCIDPGIAAPGAQHKTILCFLHLTQIKREIRASLRTHAQGKR